MFGSCSNDCSVQTDRIALSENRTVSVFSVHKYVYKYHLCSFHCYWFNIYIYINYCCWRADRIAVQTLLFFLVHEEQVKMNEEIGTTAIELNCTLIVATISKEILKFIVHSVKYESRKLHIHFINLFICLDMRFPLNKFFKNLFKMWNENFCDDYYLSRRWFALCDPTVPSFSSSLFFSFLSFPFIVNSRKFPYCCYQVVLITCMLVCITQFFF